MKASNVVGKTVARVDQQRRTFSGGPAWEVLRIVFTDGSSLTFDVLEEPNGGDYGVKPRYWKATP